jgi:HD-GYP domain-containing protein (c-di-GMP phosphodiesterase class II)
LRPRFPHPAPLGARRQIHRAAGRKTQPLAGDSAALHYGALLHDIGNIGIADSILLNPATVRWEFEEVRMHPIIGEQICKPLVTLAPLLPLVRSHHEKLNGSGYPDGLKGDEIPLLVRVFMCRRRV